MDSFPKEVPKLRHYAMLSRTDLLEDESRRRPRTCTRTEAIFPRTNFLRTTGRGPSSIAQRSRTSDFSHINNIHPIVAASTQRQRKNPKDPELPSEPRSGAVFLVERRNHFRDGVAFLFSALQPRLMLDAVFEVPLN